MKIQSYVDSCLAGSPNDGDNLDDMALETELQTTTTTPSAKVFSYLLLLALVPMLTVIQHRARL